MFWGNKYSWSPLSHWMSIKNLRSDYLLLEASKVRFFHSFVHLDINRMLVSAAQRPRGAKGIKVALG